MVIAQVTPDWATKIVDQNVKSIGLKKHCQAVGIVMARFARDAGQDEQLYRSVGILHDFDWEIHPKLPDHPLKGVELLREQGVPEIILDAILSHADNTGVLPTTHLQQSLRASDEVTGLVIATALIMPSKKLADVMLPSLLKKFHHPQFAKGVNREDVRHAGEVMDLTLEAHLELVLSALQQEAEVLGL